MISFGFTIYKFLQVFQQQSKLPALRPEAPRDVGLTLIGIGVFAVTVACVQHRKYIKKLNNMAPRQLYKALDLSVVVALLILFLGLLMFGSILLHSGPLS